MKHPKTINEAADELLKQMTEEDKNSLKATKKAKLIGYHHGLGTWIRNNFGLWEPDSPLMALKPPHYIPQEPDDVSVEIIEKAWKKLNGKK